MIDEEHEGTIDSIEAGTPSVVNETDTPRRTADWGRSVTAYIGEHPEVCLGIALVLGAAIGVVVKRR